MSGTITNIDKIALSDTKDGTISISTIDKPYGEDSQSVASIGISLQSQSTEPDWKVHIPKDNIEAVIKALQKAQDSL